MRTAMLDVFRNIAPQIFGLDPSYFTAQYKRIEIPEIRALLGMRPGDPTQHMHRHHPVLYPAHLQADKLYESYRGYIFQNPQLFKVHMFYDRSVP